MRAPAILRPALVTVLAAAAVMSVAGLAYQYSEAGHGGGLAADSPLVLAVDALGVFLALVFSTQLFAAYHLFAAPARAQFKAHRVLAFAVLGMIVLHGAGATAHAFAPPVERLPLQLVAIGTVSAAGLVVQVATGLQGPRRPRARRLHRLIVIAASALVIAHVGLGTLHAVIG
jgi:cytochrome b561